MLYAVDKGFGYRKIADAGVWHTWEKAAILAPCNAKSVGAEAGSRWYLGEGVCQRACWLMVGWSRQKESEYFWVVVPLAGKREDILQAENWDSDEVAKSNPNMGGSQEIN